MRSLAFATDLAVLAAEGSSIEHGPGATVVRTPGNPDYRWGNFVLVAAADDPRRLAALHAAAFPGAGFAAVGIDDPDAEVDEGAFGAAGFEVERNAVLVASAVAAPSAPLPPVRPLSGDADWAAALRIETDEFGEPGFCERRLAARRATVAAGAAACCGAIVDGEVVATAGVVDAGHGTVRFQDVVTRAPSRRRGCASALIVALARLAAERFGARRLVLVAEPGGPAIGLYRRLGFVEVETQLQLTRSGVGAGA